MPNQGQPDPFRDLFNDKELSSLFDNDDLKSDEDIQEADIQTCPGCAGHGRYVGLFKIEDPCQECGGSGTVRRPHAAKSKCSTSGN